MTFVGVFRIQSRRSAFNIPLARSYSLRLIAVTHGEIFQQK